MTRSNDLKKYRVETNTLKTMACGTILERVWPR